MGPLGVDITTRLVATLIIVPLFALVFNLVLGLIYRVKPFEKRKAEQEKPLNQEKSVGEWLQIFFSWVGNLIRSLGELVKRNWKKFFVTIPVAFTVLTLILGLKDMGCPLFVEVLYELFNSILASLLIVGTWEKIIERSIEKKLQR